MPMFRDLKVKLTDAEWGACASRAAEMRQSAEELKAHAKETAADNKLKVQEAEKEAKLLEEKVRTKVETRAVEVYEKPELRTFQMQMFRSDTHEFISARPMSANERHIAMQPNLPNLPIDPPARPEEKPVEMPTQEITPPPGAQAVPEADQVLPENAELQLVVNMKGKGPYHSGDSTTVDSAIEHFAKLMRAEHVKATEGTVNLWVDGALARELGSLRWWPDNIVRFTPTPAPAAPVTEGEKTFAEMMEAGEKEEEEEEKEETTDPAAAKKRSHKKKPKA